MSNDKIIQHIRDHIRLDDHSRQVADQAHNAFQLQAADLLTSSSTHHPGFTPGSKLVDMATKLLGPCMFSDHQNTTHEPSKADAANAAACHVNEKANSGELIDGADGQLLSLYSSLSDFNPQEYFAKGTVAAAIGNYQARKAVSRQASELGLNGGTAAKSFQNTDQLHDSLKAAKKQTSAA
jgi:hypothetical protein